MTLTRVARAGWAVFFALLFATAFFGGNQRQAHAVTLSDSHDDLGRMVCIVYTDTRAISDFSFPAFQRTSEDCPGEEFTSPPPSPPPAEVAGQCADGQDNDGDGFTDANDPNCHTDGDPTNTATYDSAREEAGTLPACWNGTDDDGDGKTDYPNDPGCSSPTDTSEIDVPIDDTPIDTPDEEDEEGDEGDSEEGGGGEGALPQCSDGVDNDGDGAVDSADAGCHGDFDPENDASYDPNGTDEAARAPQCSDGSDNDGDGSVDDDDPGCADASDDDEADSPPSPSGGGGGGGGGGSLGGLPPGTPLYTSTTTEPAGIVLGFATTTESCDRYLTAFIREGRDNDVDQVKRLQRFLRDFEGADSVVENGLYDIPTLAAVHIFQAKYASDILVPWGIEESTGYVYLTTRKKVNEIVCRYTKTFPLTLEEQRKIDEARAAAGLPAAAAASVAVPQTLAEPRTPAAPTPRTGTEPNEATTSGESAATTSPPAGLQGIWDFLRDIFDRGR